MNALLALDEMRASTNFNINIAAVTPFLMMAYMTKRAFQFLFYATLRMGKSREEVYGSFLQTLTEIERLLVMRDNPPTPEIQIQSGDGRREFERQSDAVLNADDLGMLMLHIHELKTILWKNRRRFSQGIIRGVAEDLAELAGERGKLIYLTQNRILAFGFFLLKFRAWKCRSGQRPATTSNHWTNVSNVSFLEGRKFGNGF